MSIVWLVAAIIAVVLFAGGWLLWWMAQPDSMGMSGIFVIVGCVGAVAVLGIGFVVQVAVWVWEAFHHVS